MLEKVINALLAAQTQLEKDTFQVALPDYASFREAVGRHRGLGEALAIIAALQDGDEDEEWKRRKN